MATVLTTANFPVEAAAVEAGPAAALPLVPHTSLASGLDVSRVIKGCWQLSGGHRGDRETDRTQGGAAIEDFSRFVAAGVTTFDTADHYGPSETLIGRFLAASPANRAASQVLTKYCVFGAEQYSAGKGDVVQQAVQEQCQRLGMQSLDLCQFYWADYGISNYLAAAQQLAEQQQRGRIRHLGLTNFDVPRCQEFLDAGIPFVSNQVQYSLLDRRPENAMVPFCLQHNMQLLPYGVLAGGLLSDKYLGVPADQVKVDTYSKSKYARVLGQVGSWAWLQRLLTALRTVADKHATSIANVATRWVLDRPAVGAVIIGARNARHVSDEQQLFTFRLDADDNARIDEVLASAQRSRAWPKTYVTFSRVLAAGATPFAVEHFHSGGAYALELQWAGPGVPQAVIPASAFKRTAT